MTSCSDALPAASAAWRHHVARDGFEVVFMSQGPSGIGLEGCTAAVEGTHPWAVRYSIAVDTGWVTTEARAWVLSALGERVIRLDHDGSGHWRLDDAARPDLEGCIDVDLESWACTNVIPVPRLGLDAGETTPASAVFVRALDLAVERLEQTYRRHDDDGDGRPRFEHMASRGARARAEDGSRPGRCTSSSTVSPKPPEARGPMPTLAETSEAPMSRPSGSAANLSAEWKQAA